jgi:thymidylate synthase (FAD)
MQKVVLLSHTLQPPKTVACAAKLCYSASGIEDLYDNLTDEKTASFLDMLSELGHESPMEHAYFTFGIEGVSRSLLAQITRHRIASFSVQSQRYVKNVDFKFVLPPEIENIPEAKEEYLKAMEEDIAHYNSLADILKAKHKKALIDEGKDEKTAERTAEKMAIEDARFVLPNAAETKMVLTMNVRSLNNFFHHRCCNRAQWEIRDLAEKMLKVCKEAAPELFKKSGPPCAAGPCPEGKMSCGKVKEMREKFLNL